MKSKSPSRLPFERLHHAGLSASLAMTEAELEQAQALRHLAFGRQGQGVDGDAFDAGAAHLLLRGAEGQLLGCCRLILHDDHSLTSGYSGQFYDLAAMAGAGPQLELGRFCLDPATRNPEVLRLGWAAITRITDHHDVRRIFGCTSFMRADPQYHAVGLAALIGHIGPESLRPARRSPEVLALAGFATLAPDPAKLPPLLRSYLAMGAWVSDHAVIDRTFDSLHVLTCLEITAIPPARARILRGIGVENMGYNNTVILNH